MDEIVGQPEFIESLSEDPTTYAIDVDEDGFDIEPCEECLECGPCEGLCEVFKSGIRAYRNLYILHWMAKGNDMMKLHIMAEEMYGELIQEIDTIGELLVEKQGTVPQLDFPCDYVPVQDYDFQTGLTQIQSLIQVYIDCIDYAYCNQTSDVQSTLDEWLRYWKKQLNYFVERQEN
jgi:DNA-binding ferritin-like protein